MREKNNCFFRRLLAVQKVRLYFVSASFFLFCTFLCTFLCSCSNNIDSMIEDYNGHFVVDTELNSYTVDNVSGDEMLLDEYPVSYLSTLCLTAPAGGVEYSWVIEIGENANGSAEGTRVTLSTSRTLSVYLRNNFYLQRWGDYKLILTVRKPQGESLMDSTILHVY